MQRRIRRGQRKKNLKFAICKVPLNYRLTDSHAFSMIKVTISLVIRGCTGFDGLDEYGEAIRGPVTTLKHGKILNAEDNLAYAA